ncbi:HAD-IIIA family hydrolase [Skermania sp. ID1734]|uniref:HAD-IIIA family hydrolase n=1 Tax=Skermania sp. ID1734 TaxID=2597516 RepID=UPI00117D9208|nr:HAD-IIIA family hydrolase [Skermania sp. ID1734]TSD99459.1 HAD-IIIA family hydrolase [Skermania sp. ID1734]
MTETPRYTVVIPTVGRENLMSLLARLDSAAQETTRPAEIIVVDDRRAPQPPLVLPPLSVPIRVLRSGGRGPAAARNIGWRSAMTEWIAFLDDDVLPSPTWPADLVTDLGRLTTAEGASQGRVEVPLPQDRRPTDAERGTAGLAQARWITADMSYRRTALAAVGGFDERFVRAFREDADLALQVLEHGYRISTGHRTVVHPPAGGTFFSSLRAQRGNQDNALMRRKYGRKWRQRIGEGPGRMRQHSAATIAATTALLLGLQRRPSAGIAAAGWAALTAEFAWRRIAPGPRTAAEVSAMVVTSALIPPAACLHRLRGEWRARRGWHLDTPEPPEAVLFDRDDTLIVDVPYNTDPARVQPVSGSVESLHRLRALGCRVGVVSNQSGVGRGLITAEQLAAVNSRVHEMLGPFDTWHMCVHGPSDGCDCRKPAPGMVRAAAAALGVSPQRCVVIGDTGADVCAAQAAGARAILVPTARTLREEVQHARETALLAPDLVSAIELALAGAR